VIRQKAVPQFTIGKAYALLRVRGAKAFPKHLRGEEQLNWAFKKARETDAGHEDEYPSGNDFLTRDVLADLAYENVRAWAEAWNESAA